MDSAIANRQRIEQLPCIAHKPENLETLFDANSFRERLYQEIKSAKKRIYLVALYLQDDEAGRGVLTALYEAKQHNPELDIKVLVDWHRAQRGLIGAAQSDGNAALYREYAKKYTHKIDVLGVPVRNREVFGVLHLKGFVIDDKVIYSGASLNDVYLAQHDRYRYDRYHVIQNEKLADSMAQFITDTLVSSEAVNCLAQADRPDTKSLRTAIRDLRSELQQATYHFETDEIASDEVGLTPLIGLGKRKNKLNQDICTLIASAQSELTICTPYFNFPRSVSREVKRALKRGVKVTIVVGDKTANDFYIPPSEPFKTIAGLPYLYEVNLRNFAKHNEAAIAHRQLAIYLWKHDNNSFHLKGIWVDRKYMLVTGNNLNPRAWKLDLENAILIHDKHQLLAEQKQKELDCILEHTQLIGSYKQIEKVDSYPVQVKKLITRIRRVKADHILNQIL
ncbi:CDP-diacylglycerol--serine O-phosphatidyltransferase [Photobacterium leiognathi]|uniref:CDP-diacylglycerol--serine O-phosphatidyltransferase n=1 Tax=Photobacterium leiognathi TaxID=553611 RepID=UPI0002088613|nr:CDP-diacylglycerol--serine O-phosphatidyltransferase [Photobacterium leiognathi]PSW47846.1 CDP-diacylglycerol--serine O-phosphatidyltransferase [Photobacterium leiognathi subsp. mandapamensis]GAA03080.1 phospholipase D Active site motif family protein [Photobacterium leiognathi subsp. mandapamensis svers.1.1.]